MDSGEVLTQYPKRLRLKIPFYDGKFGCEVFDRDGNKIEDPMDEILVRGTRVKAIIECAGPDCFCLHVSVEVVVGGRCSAGFSWSRFPSGY